MNRRAALALSAWTRTCGAALLLVALAAGAAPTPEAEFVLGPRAHQLRLNANGAPVSWSGAFDERLASSPAGTAAPAGEIRYRNRVLPLEFPKVTRVGNSPPRAGAPTEALDFAYHWYTEPGLAVHIHHSVTNHRGAYAWVRHLEIRGPVKLTSDLTVSLRSIRVPLPTNTWLPLVNGTAAQWGTNVAAVFHLAGTVPAEGASLALPMVSVPAAGGRILLAADPYFSTEFSSNTIAWTYPLKGGLENGSEHRTFVVAPHLGSVETSLAGFFNFLLPDVPPGPAWLHDIALVDFDYLSDGGQGWFHDIDTLTVALSKHDRRQAFLCLHGWYDFLGRYTYDPATGKLDPAWPSFSSWELARIKPPFGTIGGTKVPMGFENCKPMKMSVAEVHRRLQYARTRGYRVGLYYADGVNAGDGLPGFDRARVLRYGGWQGPDSKGTSYFQNPLDPRVRAFFIGYTKALLDEYGPELDALVWDETFHVRCGQLGTEALPGYADRAMLRLVRGVTSLVDDYNRQHRTQIALLTSDDLGLFGDVPCALVAHGTYQDSWCNPKAWSYGIFANYRNVLWSCCWWPVSKWSWVEFGVRHYQAPVSLSNGWGDDQGFSELTPAEQAKAMALFNWRKQHVTHLKWLERLEE